MESTVVDNPLQLTTCKKRIRHIGSVSLRNLSYMSADVNSLGVFFTLHTSGAIFSQEFYKSETLHSTLNPNWESLDLGNLNFKHTANTCVTLRVWVEDVLSTAKVHLEYDLDLQALVEMNTESHALHSDCLILCVSQTPYVLPSVIGPCYKEHLYLRANMATAKTSYCLKLLSRLQTVLRAVKQTEQTVELVRRKIQLELQNTEDVTSASQIIELSKVRVAEFKSRLEKASNAITLTRSKLYSRRADNSKLEKGVSQLQDAITSHENLLSELHSDHINKREKLLKANLLLQKRQRQLLHELCIIFPIEEMDGNKFYISGINLPNLEATLNSQDEMSVAAALGNTAHLVKMLSNILCVPLQYPLECLGSRSQVYDCIVTMSGQKDRVFPLYSRGKDRQAFRYGVFLLSKNVAQLRFAYGQPTKDLRLILWNLKDFLLLKLGQIGIPRSHLRTIMSAPALLRSESAPPPLSDSEHLSLQSDAISNKATEFHAESYPGSVSFLQPLSDTSLSTRDVLGEGESNRVSHSPSSTGSEVTQMPVAVLDVNGAHRAGSDCSGSPIAALHTHQLLHLSKVISD